MRFFNLAIAISCLFLIGCSSLKIRLGPLGTGIATPDVGPGVEAAISDKDGNILAGFRVSLNLPRLLNQGYQWVRNVLPAMVFNLWPTAGTPTGPEPPPVDKPPQPMRVAILHGASPG